MLAGIYASQMMKKSGGPSLRDIVIATFAGSGGAFYDLTDISTLWQDSARTMPATSVGQIVKGITDLSGNGAHLSTPSTGVATIVADTDSPTGVTLEFSGTYSGDGFVSVPKGFGTPDGVVACSSYRQAASSGTTMATIGAYHVNAKRVQPITLFHDGGIHFTYFIRDTGSGYYRTLDDYTAYGAGVQAMETRIASPELSSIRHNGTETVAAVIGYDIAEDANLVPITLGVDHGGTFSPIYNKMEGRMYCAYMIDRNLAPTELNAVESYIAYCAGV